MITVAARPSDVEVVREFFELFKTPWQLYPGQHPTSVLLCNGVEIPESDAAVVLVYGAAELAEDRTLGLRGTAAGSGWVLEHRSGALPIYGSGVCFKGSGESMLKDSAGQAGAVVVGQDRRRVRIRVGYDLFGEVRHLLTVGQPEGHALLPTLETHIAVLREAILAHGVSLVEIPPVPLGHPFIVCLTHDVDHPRLRDHCCDHTMFGFMHRAIIGSLTNRVRGRLSWSQVWTNWWAAARAPLVLLGMARDFWQTFDRYKELEHGLGSTFFFIPFRGEPGIDPQGKRREKRAAQYDVRELEPTLRSLLEAGHEIGVHGLEAWRDEGRGVAERQRIEELTGGPESGIRMHWLYFTPEAPAKLEAAGYSYDSTIGYNGAVGFRPGTAQVYRPLGLARLLELPMQIMDTALFYPAHLDLSPSEARQRVVAVIDQVRALGGALTVNWHDRSLAPERLWDRFYVDLLERLKAERPWFSTAANAVRWFRARRSVTFESVAFEADRSTVRVRMPALPAAVPKLRLRVYPARSAATQPPAAAAFTDLELAASGDYRLAA